MARVPLCKERSPHHHTLTIGAWRQPPPRCSAHWVSAWDAAAFKFLSAEQALPEPHARPSGGSTRDQKMKRPQPFCSQGFQHKPAVSPPLTPTPAPTPTSRCLCQLFPSQMAPNVGRIFLWPLPGSPFSHSTSRWGNSHTGEGRGLKTGEFVTQGPQRGGRSSD